MLDDHAGENAELYALGQLNEMEIARLERHARTCDECARRLGEAEATVLRLIESGELPGARPAALDERVRFGAVPRVPWGWLAAVAAAFVLGLLPWGMGALRAPEPSQTSQLAMNAMLAGHFVHAPFAPLVPNAPQAKVVYAREGGWLYVIVGPFAQPLDVVAIAGGKASTIASIAPGASVRAAFVSLAGRVESVQLRERGAPIASARVVY